MLSRFYLIPERYEQTNMQRDGLTDRQNCYISISRVSLLTRDKNPWINVNVVRNVTE